MHKTFMDEDEGFFLENRKYSTIFRKIIPIKEKVVLGYDYIRGKLYCK